MTKEELAAKLNGREYGAEITGKESHEAEDAGLVVVFGYSDDNVELRGAINDEIGCGDSGTLIPVTSTGLLINDCEDEDCPYFQQKAQHAASIEPLWDKEGYSWIYKTAIPHATFDIEEDGDKYCRGIVFALADVGAA